MIGRQAGAAASCAAPCALVAAFVVQAPAPVVLPVERASNVFFVRTTVNGGGPFWFTVDTGSTLTVIDPSTATRAELPVRPAGRRHVGVGAEASELQTTSGATIQVEGLPPFSPARLYVVPVQASANPLGHAIDGVLGSDVLRDYVVEIDYAASRVTLSAPRGGSAAAGDNPSAVPITVEGNVLLALATLVLPDESRVPARLLIDTGTNGSLTLTTPYVRRHGLDRFPPVGASAAIGINGMSVSPVIQLRSIAFGSAIIQAPGAALSNSGSGLLASGDFDGIIGAALLRRFRLVIDYPRRRLYLLAPSSAPAPGIASARR